MTETEPTTKEVFKPILLYTDNKNKAGLMDSYSSNIELHNILILESETLLKRKLAKKEIQALLKNHIEFSEYVKSLIRNEFQFPSSDEEFNLRALGFSFDKLDSAVSNIQDNTYKYLIDEGKIIADSKQIIAIDEQCRVYTKNEKQNLAYLVAVSLKDLANKLNELGIVNGGSSLFSYTKATNFLVQTDGVNGLKFNFYKILSIN